MSKRVDQVNELLRREIAMAIERDVELPGVLATVMEVHTSPDLHDARVAISILPDNQAGSAMAAIRKQQGLIYAALKKKVSLRRIPVLTFIFDDTHKHASALQKAISEGAIS